MPDLIHYDGWQPFNIPPGSWLVFVADFGSAHGTYWEIKPKPGSAPQTIRLPVRGLTPMEGQDDHAGFPARLRQRRHPQRGSAGPDAVAAGLAAGAVGAHRADTPVAVALRAMVTCECVFSPHRRTECDG
ncbi:MAG: hypothetical protein WDO13_18410 [Verrucomicrobiota bacterium]